MLRFLLCRWRSLKRLRLTAGACLMIVYRLITNYSRHGRGDDEAGRGRMNKTVGIVGLGIMGGAIARNLLERGWTVIGSDIDLAKRAELASAGVVIAADLKQLARETEIIMTSLPSAAAADAVARDIAASGAAQRIVVELSTLTIADKLRINEILEKAGHVALDCPLSGTGAQAKTRDLIVYASGERESIARCTALFSD